ncbi:MAG TPA: hypothetical protein VGF79_06675 [Bacteroidia bacterium]
MSNKENDPIEEQFKSLFNLNDIDPETQTWDKILEGINNKEKRKKRIFVWFFSIGMFLMIVGIILNKDKILYSKVHKSISNHKIATKQILDSNNRHRSIENNQNLNSNQAPYRHVTINQQKSENPVDTLSESNNTAHITSKKLPINTKTSNKLDNNAFSENENHLTDTLPNIQKPYSKYSNLKKSTGLFWQNDTSSLNSQISNLDEFYLKIHPIDSPFSTKHFPNGEWPKTTLTLDLRTPSNSIKSIDHKDTNNTFKQHFSLAFFLQPYLQKNAFKGNSEIANYRKEHDQLGLGYSSQLAIQYHFHKNFSFSLGFGLQSFTFQSDNRNLNLQKTLVDSIKAITYNWNVFYFKQYDIDSHYFDKSLKTHFKSFIVPIGFQYNRSIRKNIRTLFSSGIVYNRTIQSIYEFNYNTFNIGSSSPIAPSIKKDLFQLQLGVGLEYTLNKQFSVSATPQYSTYFGSIANDQGFSERPYSIGIQFGLIYKLNKKNKPNN